MKKIFAIFMSILFIASLSFAVVGCGKIEEESANLRKAAAELKAQNDAKKAESEVKAKDDATKAAADVKGAKK
ncbi:MAG: hypothetical protein WC373_03535 [Smithella sp.]|jgi:uncharacterized lipoprotein YehR (DUF1307 family)